MCELARWTGSKSGCQPSWWLVTSEFSLGDSSVSLSLISEGDLGEGIKSTPRRFVYDTKVDRTVYLLEGRKALHLDMDRLDHFGHI